MLWPQNLKKYDLCWEKGDFFFGGGWGGGCVQFGREELGWGRRRRRNRGGEGQQSGGILTFFEGITDGLILSVIPSAILMENWSRHCTEIRVWIPRWFNRENRPQKVPRQRTAFFKILNIPFVITLVYTDRSIPSVYTNWITDRIVSVGNYHCNKPT